MTSNVYSTSQPVREIFSFRCTKSIQNLALQWPFSYYNISKDRDLLLCNFTACKIIRLEREREREIKGKKYDHNRKPSAVSFKLFNKTCYPKPCTITLISK